MNVAQQDEWLEQLPQVKNSIKVLLQDNTEHRIPEGRIRREERSIAIDPIKAKNADGFPALGPTIRFPLAELVRIEYKDDDGTHSHFGPSTRWLTNLPRSRENAIFLFCLEENRTLFVEKGWIEYDARRIYIREIVGNGKRGYTLIDHERSLDEVLIILVNRQKIEPMVFMRTAGKM